MASTTMRCMPAILPYKTQGRWPADHERSRLFRRRNRGAHCARRARVFALECVRLADKLYIVDGHGYIFRAHYGLMNSSRGERREVRLSTSEGMPTGALYVFSRMLMKLEEDFAPRRMAVVFDDKSGARTFRAAMYPAYKATRKEPPEELQVQMDYFAKVVGGMGWPVLAVPGVEADDVIATLVDQARERDWEVVIFSADKDIMQMVGERVEMIDALHQKTY